MKFKKLFTLLLVVVFALTTFTACSKDKKSTESSAHGFDTNSIIGKVTAINGSTLTLALVEMPNRGMNNKDQKDGGAMPSGAPDGKGQGNGAMPSGAPDGKGQWNGTRPSGAPDGKGQGGSQGNRGNFFKETGETKSVDVTDESLIKLRSGRDETQGSLKDIAVDSYVTVQYADDGTTIKAIVVQGNMGGNDSQNGNNSANSNASQDSSNASNNQKSSTAQ